MNRKFPGFTLVEILIVVIILGILAAIVIPQFTNASNEARIYTVQSTLQMVRGQIELFKIQHNDNPPVLDSSWAVMLNRSTIIETGPHAGTSNGRNGPYLQMPPVNPLTGSSTIISSTTTPTDNDGWSYNANTGLIKIVVPSTVDKTLEPYTFNGILNMHDFAYVSFQ